MGRDLPLCALVSRLRVQIKTAQNLLESLHGALTPRASVVNDRSEPFAEDRADDLRSLLENCCGEVGVAIGKLLEVRAEISGGGEESHEQVC